MRKRSVIRFSVLCGAVIILTACLAMPVCAKMPWEVWDYSKEKPVRGGYYRTAATLDVGLLNPNHWPVQDWLVINYFFEKFLITDGSYRPVPWMVELWEYPDPLTCIMKLKKGITFSDGVAFNAYAMKYQIDWIMDTANGCWSRGWLKPLKSIEEVDEYTVKWTFTSPWAAFLGIIANVPGYAISPEALKKGSKWTDTNPVGTGQWILEDRSTGNFIKVKRNPNWWYGKSIGHPDMPYYDGRITTIIPDASVQLANLRAGRIDNMTLSKVQYNMVKNDKKLNVYIFPVNHVRALAFNHAKGPCKDIRVRQAVSLAIDRKALIIGTEFGMGRMATCMYPEDHWAYNPNLKPWPYKPEKAKKLLAEAGYPRGLKLEGYMAPTPQSVNLTEAIKAMLAEVGIDWKVDMLEAAARSDRMKNLEYDLAGGGWTWIYDPDLQATGLYHPDGGFNYGRSHNEKAIELIEAGRKEVNFEKRKKIYYELQQVLYDNVEDAWLFYEMWPTAYNKNVRGYNHDMIVKHKEIWAWSHPTWFKEGKP
jgi:peptide/nickel transport system substrate-binding protein